MTRDRKKLPVLLGGEKALTDTLPGWPRTGAGDMDRLRDVLDSGQWWSKGGNEVSQFERRFAEFHGCREGIACANGTHGLELALRALNVGPGDEVIVPAMTFISTSMAVMQVGARPVPVDIEAGSWCLTAEAVRRAVSRSTRAIIPVHFAGQICEMDRIFAVADEFNLHVVEDAAHAHGAVWNGRPAGAFGIVSVFSFQNFKLMTAGEGGILITNDAVLARKLRLIVNCGRADGDRAYFHEVLGTNSRMTEFQGAILNGQMDHLSDLAERRARNGALLRELLKNHPSVSLQRTDSRTDRHAWYMVVMACRLEAFGGLTRDQIVQVLLAEGLPACRIYPPVQRTPHFAADYHRLGGELNDLPACPVSEQLGEIGIWLHHRLLLGGEDLLAQTVEAINKTASHGAALAGHLSNRSGQRLTVS